jgi:hypothetical protein
MWIRDNYKVYDAKIKKEGFLPVRTLTDSLNTRR